MSDRAGRVKCPHCGTEDFATSITCWQCGKPLRCVTSVSNPELRSQEERGAIQRMQSLIAQATSSRPSTVNAVDAGTLLKAATERKGKGDLDGAIQLLRQAYTTISTSSTIYPVATFIRLPQYLQLAGRTDEAWQEFVRLLTHGYPNQMKSPEILPMDQSIIYDKMRLFLQRSGRENEAIKYGILSLLSWAVGLHRQKRRQELRTCLSKRAIAEQIRSLLPGSRTSKQQVDQITDLIMTGIDQSFPDLDLARIARDVDRILGVAG